MKVTLKPEAKARSRDCISLIVVNGKQHPSKKLQPSSRIRVDLLSYDSKPTEIQGQYDWTVEKNWTGSTSPVEIFYIDDSSKNLALAISIYFTTLMRGSEM